MHPSFQAREFQLDDVARVLNFPRTGLAHSPGTGKTFIAAIATNCVTSSTNESVVWTMPGGILAKNKRDILFSTHLQDNEVAIVQGTKLQRAQIYGRAQVKVFLMTATTFANEWELLPTRVKHSVHDEIHLAYSTDGSKRTQEFYRATRKHGMLLPMTGTVIRGRLDSAYPICHTLAPWAYGSYRSFQQHHAYFDEYGRVLGWRYHDRLKVVLEKCMIFRSFAEVYGKENKVIQVVPLELSEKVRKLYTQLEKTALIELQDSYVDGGNPATAAIRARQLLAAPELFEIDDEVTEKDQYLQVLIEDHLKSGERLCIFSASTQEQLRVVAMIEKLKGTVGHINGTVSNTRRAQIDSEFTSGKLQFVVASSATAGIGFSWNFLETMVFLSLDYMDDSFLQAMRRGIRGVRETPLRVIILKYAETIDQRILEIIDRKSRDFNKVDSGIEILNLSQL